MLQMATAPAVSAEDPLGSISRRPTMQVVTYPGRGTDDGEDFEDWSMHALRERVKLVQELDQLADRMVELALRLTREAQVIEEEYFLPQTRKVLVTTL